MKRIYFLTAFVVLLFPSLSQAQFSMQNGDHTFQISGDIMAGYNYNLNQPGNNDFHKNNFLLDEARFRFLGRIGNKLQYKLEMDLADLAADIQSPAPPLGFIKDAYIMYKTKYVYIQTGYEKLPFGFNGLIDEIYDPFLSRPELITKINSRRDLGVTLSHIFPVLHVNVYGGVYSGLGEEAFSTTNTNGTPEYVGRIEYAYPSKYQLTIIDRRNSPVPVIEGGAGIRYADNSVTSNDGDIYDLLTVNGKKTTYEADATVFYRGFSFQIESQHLRVNPLDSTRLIADGKKYSYFRAGGYLAELNYNWKQLKSILCVRYDELNPTDLTYGNTERTIAFAYNYEIRQNFLCVKIQYEHHLPTPYENAIWKDDNIRAEFQVIFN